MEGLLTRAFKLILAGAFVLVSLKCPPLVLVALAVAINAVAVEPRTNKASSVQS